MIKIDIKVGLDQTVVIGECHIEVEVSMDKITEEGHNMIKIIEVILGKEILEECKIIEDKKVRVGYRGNFKNNNFGRGRSRSRERQYSGNCRRNYRSSSRLRSGSRASTHSR